MEWLTGNLALSYPFGDSVTDPLLTALFADALITSTVPGPYTLTAFDPQAISNGIVTIMAGATTVLSVTTMTQAALGAFTVLNAVDSGRGSSCRFIVSTLALASYPALTSPAVFVPDVCNVENTAVTTLNGLEDDVVISFNQSINATPSANGVVVSAVDPSARVACPDVPEVLSINGQRPNQFGSLVLGVDGCLRLIPNPALPHQLIVADFCTPCVSTPLAQVINSRLTYQASYYYQLAAIYQDQFNRYQRFVAEINAKLATTGARSSILIPGSTSSASTGLNPDSLIDISGRAFNRPYFSQLALGVTNSSPFAISVAITVTIGSLSTVTEPVAGSGSIQRYLINGPTMDTFAPFPGTVTFDMAAREIVSIGSELHIKQILTTGPSAGQWRISATVTFLSGPGALPSPRTFTATYPIQILTASFTTPPATTS